MTPLKEIRKKAKLTQEDVAKMLGVSRVTISKYENGVLTLPVEHAFKLGKELNIEWPTLYENDQQGIDALNKRVNSLLELGSEVVENSRRLREERRQQRINAAYNKLNETDREEAVKRVEELAMLAQYRVQHPETSADAAQTGAEDAPGGEEQDG